METAAAELAAETRQLKRWAKQTIKLEKRIVKLKEERTELKKQVVGGGKVVVNEKIYTRQQAELASYRKKNKISTVREQNAEAMVPYRDDLEKIKEMIHEVNETEVVRPSLPQFCVAAPEVNETEAVDFSEQREMVWCGQPGCELVCECAYYNSERTRETGFQESERKTIHDVNEAEVAAPEVNETEAAGMSGEDFKEYLEACCESSDEEVNETNVM